MSSQPKKLTWNATQVKILEMLKAGTSSHHHISEVLGINISVVTKVSNAVKKGQSPATPYVTKTKKKSAHSTSKWGVSPSYLGQNQQTETIDEEEIFQGDANAPSKAGGVNQAGAQNSTSNYSQETATVAKLYAVSVAIPITPIMLAAKDYVIQRLHWPPDLKWEDLIDTILYHYFKSRRPSVILQGWIEGEASDSSPKPVTGNGKGNADGGINPNDPNSKDMAEAVADALFKKMNRSATLADTNVCIVDWNPNRYSQ